ENTIHLLKKILVKLLISIQKEDENRIKLTESTTKKYDLLNTELESKIKYLSTDIKETLSRVNKYDMKILPLIDNYLFSYMQQLTFLPSIRDAIIEMSSIERSNFCLSKKEQVIVEVSKQVYPVIEACLRYVMIEGTPYPTFYRNHFFYKSLL
ncbi:MAG: hypothetical protein WCO06_02640, partial [Candidatus Roizmanbacteria bacterium]